MRYTKLFYKTKVVTNQNLQLLCYVTFFDILHHYRVIVASQICSVEKVLCRHTEQIFFFYLFIYLFIHYAPEGSILDSVASVIFFFFC